MPLSSLCSLSGGLVLYVVFQPFPGLAGRVIGDLVVCVCLWRNRLNCPCSSAIPHSGSCFHCPNIALNSSFVISAALFFGFSAYIRSALSSATSMVMPSLKTLSVMVTMRPISSGVNTSFIAPMDQSPPSRMRPVMNSYTRLLKAVTNLSGVSSLSRLR